MRFAIFSDVHANLPALKSVLASIENLGIEKIFCLGDLVDFAPWQNECIELIREKNIPTVCGNHDERVAFNREVKPLAWHSKSEQNARLTAINYSKSTLTENNKIYLKSLPTSIKIDLEDNKNRFHVLLVHASNTSLSEYIYEDHPEGDLINIFSDENVTAIVTGHTHIAYIREIYNENIKLTIANAGAVGRIKKGQPKATWIEGEFEQGNLNFTIHAVDYDVLEVVSAIKSSDIPDFYAEDLVKNAPATL